MMGIEIDWTLIVQIGMLICLVYMAISLADLKEGNRRNMNTLYKYLDEIKNNQ